MDKIDLKDKNLEPEIEKIFNEIYQDFITRYGAKHSERIKQLLVEISTNVRKVDSYEGAIASANRCKGVIYGKNQNLPAILKHELCHVFNDSYFDSKDETCLTYFPDRYKIILEEKGLLQEEYKRQQEEYKERWKDQPERLKYLLVDYEEYRDGFTFGDGSQETEKWTEWFNTKINTRDMKNYFTYWEDGFYSKNISSHSFYDYYISISEMISKLIPEDKLIDMFMKTPEYTTDFSYKDLIDTFDNTYTEALSDEEEQNDKYPYLKILSDTKKIEDNARKDKSVAMEAYQNCTETCFRAYLQKINSIENYNEDVLKKVYDEIKDLQESMMWNVDVSKMGELGYVQVLMQIQDKFKEMCASLNVSKQNDEILNMAESIDYRDNSKFKMIENGEKIVQEVSLDKDEEKDNSAEIGKYTANVGARGIKGNLYESLKTLFGNEAFNLLFEQYQNENISSLTDSKNGNKLLELFNKIDRLEDNLQDENTQNEILDIYDEIYGLYNQKMNEQLVTDENVALYFERIASGIVNLEENGLFNSEDGKYPDSMELVIQNYKEKEREYEQFIRNATEKNIERKLIEDPSETQTNERRIKNMWEIPNEEIEKLKSYISQIENNREERIRTNNKSETQHLLQETILKDESHKHNVTLTPHEIAQASINSNITTENMEQVKELIESLSVEKENQKSH